MENVTYKEGRTTAIISYITIIGCLIALFMNLEPKNPFARFHIRQALGIHILFYALGFLISQFDSWLISSAFYVFIIVLWGYGFIGALQCKKTQIPFLGEKFQQWFKFVN
ncbi:hypothetical protein [Ascidiimonas aurantiaca]|uniref:DUF4870 domain-containing protein n=1 Tax=Ascidiimonas aurantiaca TaxID=1685432 RepID=UPI0030EF9629